MNSGIKAAEQLYDTIIEVNATNVTPVIPGGPFTRTVSENAGKALWEGVRPTALRGLWRWWIRALLAGVLWEKGIRNYDYQVLTRLEAKELGLGSVSGEPNDRGEASKLVLLMKQEINADPLNKHKFSIPSNFTFKRKKFVRIDVRSITRNYLQRGTNYFEEPWKVLLSIPRYALLMTGKAPWEAANELWERQPIPPCKLTLKVSLKARDGIPLKRASRVIGSVALILALTLGGVGQATSRGFGKMVVKDVKGERFAEKLANKLNGSIDGNFMREVINELINNIPANEIESLVKETKKLVKKYGKDSGLALNHLPMVPTFHPDVAQLRIISNPKCRYEGKTYQVNDVWKALVAIGRACLKTEWKILHGSNVKASGKFYHTWPLGLPRYVRGTGYALQLRPKANPGRLASLVRFTVFPGDESPLIIIYAFKTMDLQVLRGKLHHLGTRSVPIKGLKITDPTMHRSRPIYVSNLSQYLDVALRTVVWLLS